MLMCLMAQEDTRLSNTAFILSHKPLCFIVPLTSLSRVLSALCHHHLSTTTVPSRVNMVSLMCTSFVHWCVFIFFFLSVLVVWLGLELQLLSSNACWDQVLQWSPWAECWNRWRRSVRDTGLGFVNTDLDGQQKIITHPPLRQRQAGCWFFCCHYQELTLLAFCQFLWSRYCNLESARISTVQSLSHSFTWQGMCCMWLQDKEEVKGLGNITSVSVDDL